MVSNKCQLEVQIVSKKLIKNSVWGKKQEVFCG